MCIKDKLLVSPLEIHLHLMIRASLYCLCCHMLTVKD